MASPIFAVNSLKHAYAGETVLEIDHLAVQPASIVGLIGPNGSGKSTLLKLLGLIEKPTQGTIHFNGRPVEPFSDEARFLITLLPQEPFLVRRNVFRNVSFGLKLRGNPKDTAERVDEALALVGLSGEAFRRRPWYALSGGEAQRVALAARLALKPKVLLMDEPTASVDAGSAQLIKEVSLRARRELGTTLIIASHDWQWLNEICDEIFHLFNGRIFGTGRENIIFGRWQNMGSGKWGKILSDGQQVIVPVPPHPEAAAVINVLSFGEDDTSVRKEDVGLSGTVSRLSLERKTGHIFATILAGGLPFTIRLTPEQHGKDTILPGKTLKIRYRLDQVKWI